VQVDTSLGNVAESALVLLVLLLSGIRAKLAKRESAR
jgi:hypothetical protein